MFTIISKKLKSDKIRACGGFTMIEMMVSLTIFVVITGIVLVNFPSFSSRVALDNLAHEVALAVRQAQVYGVSARESSPGSGVFGSHGIRFSSSENTSFLLYADLDDSNKYTGVSELLETFSVQRRNYISQICGFTSSVSSCTVLQTLDITFTRPNPEPLLLGVTGSGDSSYSYATIVITSPSGATRTIAVWSTGQIAIQ